MKKKIIFQKCNFNYIYFLLYMLAYIAINTINIFLEPTNVKEKIVKKNYQNISKDILEIFTLNLSDFIAIIPYLIRKILIRSNNNNENYVPKNSKKLIYNDQIDNKKKRKKLILYFILIATLDYLKDFMAILFNIIFPEEDYNFFPFGCTVIFDIILQFICSYLILKIQLYKRQRFSLYLNVVIFVFILTFDLIDILKFRIIKGYSYITYPFYLIFYCLEFAFGKKVILFGYISIYVLIIVTGAIKLIFNSILSLVVVLIKNQIFIAFALYFSELKNILLIIGKIIANFFYGLFLWIIIDRFSPNHTPLVIIGEEICNFVIDLIVFKKFFEMGGYKYIRIILYVISFIGVLLHNEIVIINICGLGSDTKYFLDNIVESEEEYANSDEPDILKKFETLEMIKYSDEDSQTI